MTAFLHFNLQNTDVDLELLKAVSAMSAPAHVPEQKHTKKIFQLIQIMLLRNSVQGMSCICIFLL